MLGYKDKNNWKSIIWAELLLPRLNLSSILKVQKRQTTLWKGKMRLISYIIYTTVFVSFLVKFRNILFFLCRIERCNHIIRRAVENLNINLACLSVCLYSINVKTAEPIGPKFFVGHNVTTGKVYEW